jgi:FdhD protein
LPTLTRDWAPSADAIRHAAARLTAQQPMNRLNQTVHGAAWVSREGEIQLVREDVGRHNALDKLIGALLSKGNDLKDGFVLMTSRCSFELVQKTVTAGIGALVTVSAPTALALDLARKSILYLASLGPSGPVVFNS